MHEPRVPLIPPPEVVEAFTSAAITALQELTQLEAFAEPTPDPAATALTGKIVSAAVRLERRTPGTMTLVMEDEVASCLASHYLPPGSELNEGIIDDVIGEFANVIAGQAKTILKGTPYHFLLTIPVVTRAESCAPSSITAGTTLFASLVTEPGRVLVLVDLPRCATETA